MAHWINAVDGDFNNRKDWSTHRVPIYSTVHKDDAIFDAVGGNYTVTLTTNADVKGLRLASNATLSTSGLGEMLVNTGVINAGTIKIGDGYSLDLLGASVSNTGLLALNAATGNSLVDVEANVSLTGGGKVTLSDSAFNGIVDRNIFGGNTATFTNVDNTLSGAGVLGSGGLGGGGVLTVVNQSKGVIDATGSLNPLILNTPGATLTNGGLLEATGAAGLNIAATTVDGSGGGAIYAANGSIVRLESATVAGGMLTSAGTGVIQASGGSILDGSAFTVTNTAMVTVVDNDTLVGKGSIANMTTIALTGTSSGSGLVVSGAGLALSGGGVVSLGDTSVNYISADSAAGTLTNVDNLIIGDGQLGRGQLNLVNQVNGVIDETGASGLTIDTGGSVLTNAGLIEANGAGGLIINFGVDNRGLIEANGAGALAMNNAVVNIGKLEANGGTLIAYQAVTGAGSAAINGGLLDFVGAFNENVTFTGSTGVLELAHSRGYGATVTGFSATGGTSFDLGDIKFVSAGEATFSGTASAGTLTVTDGKHTTHIAMTGNFLGSTFVTAKDGQGGVTISATTPAALTRPTQAFVAAMAGFGAAPGASAHAVSDADHARPAMLAVPRTALA